MLPNLWQLIDEYRIKAIYRISSYPVTWGAQPGEIVDFTYHPHGITWFWTQEEPVQSFVYFGIRDNDYFIQVIRERGCKHLKQWYA